MPFTYAVPLSTFQDLFRVTDKALHPELTRRLKTEIQGDVSRRLAGPRIGTLMGQHQTSIEAVEAHGDILFYSPMEFAAAAASTGQPQPLVSAAKPGLGSPVAGALAVSDRKWRYPGDAAGGVFSQSVNAVLARSHILINEFKTKSRELREGK
jgi:hypothetical protein